MGYIIAPGPKLRTTDYVLAGSLVAGFFGLLFWGTMKLGDAMVVKRIEAGKRYRLFFKTVPAVPQAEMAAAVNALTLAGASRIDTSTSATETRISYEQTPTVSKEMVLGTPAVRFGVYELIPIKVEELS